MVHLLVDENLKKNDFLEWRFSNFHFWFDKIRDIIEITFKRYGVELEAVEIHESQVHKPYYGFSPTNIKELHIHYRKNGTVEKLLIYLPVIGKYDLFFVNSSYYILIAEIADRPISAFHEPEINKTLLNFKFARLENHKLYIGNKQLALAPALYTCGYLNKSDFEQVDQEPDITKGIVSTKDGKILRYKKFEDTAFDKFILSSIEKVKYSDLFSTSYLKTINSFNVDTFYLYQVELFYGLQLYDKDTATILKSLLEISKSIFENAYANQHNFITLDQKHVVYYDAIVSYLINQLDQALTRRFISKNRIDNKTILKWLLAGNTRFRFLNTIDNPFREYNMKETVFFDINYLPDRFRTVHQSYINRIDPVNTPDNDSLGQVQRVSKHVKLDQLGRFI